MRPIYSSRINEKQTDDYISARRPDLIKINNKERELAELWTLVDHCVKMKERERREKYLDIAREMKRLWNMKVTIIPIVIGALCKITKGLVQGLEVLEITGRMETIQTIVLLRSARILRRVLET